jgi:4-hydroxy-3-polyprenylbenzoate decarboxylase
MINQRESIQMESPSTSVRHRLVVGITGASGVILGIRLLEICDQLEIETHLIVSHAARLTIQQETSWKIDDVLHLASYSYDYGNIGAKIASGSYTTNGMVIIPCSIKTLSAIANCYTGDLISRTADVTLKEGRCLLLVVRETPYHIGHIQQMEKAALSGAIIFPPVPPFYSHPQKLSDIIDGLVGRILLRLGFENDCYKPWDGVS